MPEPNEPNIDHVQQKLNKIFETRYDTDRVRNFIPISIHVIKKFNF